MAGTVDFKFISVEKLQEILKDLPSEAIVWPNTVGNLTVYESGVVVPTTRPFEREAVALGPMLGWIDVLEGEYERALGRPLTQEDIDGN